MTSHQGSPNTRVFDLLGEGDIHRAFLFGVQLRCQVGRCGRERMEPVQHRRREGPQIAVLGVAPDTGLGFAVEAPGRLLEGGAVENSTLVASRGQHPLDPVLLARDPGHPQ